MDTTVAVIYATAVTILLSFGVLAMRTLRQCGEKPDTMHW